IGTAQLAYNYGLSAWWFTLGAGIACLVLALFYVVPLRKMECATITEMISKEFGKPVGKLASLLSAFGTFINIISQLLSATAIIELLFPQLPLFLALLFSAAIMMIYVIFGGVRSAGFVGIFKLILLYAAVIIGGVTAIRLAGGFDTIYSSLDHHQYFNLFARGFGKDGGAGLSLILGVLCTQSYAQALLSARTDREAKRGAVMSAFLIPPIGIGGILIGLYMRLAMPDLASAKNVFPMFIQEHMPSLLTGIIFATLFIAVVGSGAGLSLGISSIITNNLVKNWKSPQQKLVVSRLLIVGVLVLACFFSTGKLGDVILNFAFMSMGLRAAVVFAPLACALWWKGRVDAKWAAAAVVAGPLVVLVFGLLNVLPFDPLFLGIAAAIVLCVIGAAGKKDPARL
nr:sodium:solute symporter family protein [Clostridia bacterium]